MMKKSFIAVPALGLLYCTCLAAEQVELKNDDDRATYSIGHRMGSDFKRQGIDINPEVLVQGVQDAVSGAKPLMTPEEIQTTLVDLRKRALAAQREKLKKKSDENLAKAQAFLAENAQKQGVKTLTSGLQYKVITEGSGKSPQKDGSVTVHYRGTLIDGTEFDSSYSRDKPTTFQADRVIPGWTEALQLMKEGAKWQLFIPPKLAYGERGAGGRIPSNSALVFEVELLSVN